MNDDSAFGKINSSRIQRYADWENATCSTNFLSFSLLLFPLLETAPSIYRSISLLAVSSGRIAIHCRCLSRCRIVMSSRAYLTTVRITVPWANKEAKTREPEVKYGLYGRFCPSKSKVWMPRVDGRLATNFSNSLWPISSQTKAWRRGLITSPIGAVTWLSPRENTFGIGVIEKRNQNDWPC